MTVLRHAVALRQYSADYRGSLALESRESPGDPAKITQLDHATLSIRGATAGRAAVLTWFATAARPVVTLTLDDEAEGERVTAADFTAEGP